MIESDKKQSIEIHRNEPYTLSYTKYFKGTKQLAMHFKDKDLEIIENVRKFSSTNKEGGYDEVFSNDKQTLFGGISKQISFLFPPNIRAFQNRIGFRYYMNNPLLSGNQETPYFTLVIIGNRKFIILEKDSEIEDWEGNTFKIKELNCLNIILNIIHNKIVESKNDFILPNTIAEILGFIYAAKTIQNEKIEIMDPYYPSPFIPKTMTEDFKNNFNKIYLEPIIYDKHASLLLIIFEKAKEGYTIRKNILFDMGGRHYKNFINENFIFLDGMLCNLKKFPENQIQYGNSCSMWLYASILTLLENKFVIPPENDLLVKIINKVYELYNIEERDIIFDKNSNKINKQRLVENIAKNKFVSYKIALKNFINIIGIGKQFYCSQLTDYLGIYQKIYYEQRNKLDLYKINNEYNKVIFNKSIINSELIKEFEDYINIWTLTFDQLIMEKIDKLKILSKPFTKDSLSKVNLSIKEYEEFLEKITNKLHPDTEKILFTRKKLHKLYFDSSDIFLGLLDY